MKKFFDKSKEEDIRRDIESAKIALSCLFAQCIVGGFNIAELILELTKGKDVSVRTLLDEAAAELTEKIMPGIDWAGLSVGSRSADSLLSTRYKITASIYSFWEEIKDFEKEAKILLYRLGFPDIWVLRDNVLVVDTNKLEALIQSECECNFTKEDEAELKLIEELSKCHRKGFYPAAFISSDGIGADVQAYSRWLKSRN